MPDEEPQKIWIFFWDGLAPANDLGTGICYSREELENALKKARRCIAEGDYVGTEPAPERLHVKEFEFKKTLKILEL